MKTKTVWLCSICFGLFLFSCNLEKTIEVEIPKQEKGLVVEAYLEKGKPLMVLLMETDPYFDSLRLPLLANADIRLETSGVSDSLLPKVTLDIQNRKLYNFESTYVPDGSEGVFNLKVAESGRLLFGSCRFLAEPLLDTIEVQYNPADSMARFLFWIKDFSGESNFYRVLANQDSLSGSNVLDFTFTDNGFDGKIFPLITGYRFEKGKKIIVRLFHIEQQYYQYLRAISAADRSNGNPFAQPSTIRSPMEGNGYGIFTSLNYRTIILQP